uniref:Uncharacterized protein n=1 Tax=Ixodes ricinus TaxID=34613 RepID=A0A6B0UUH3_IXORI
MWLQPPSFSIVTLHLGHSLVLAAIQLEVSLSSSHFFCHFLSRWHLTGSCQFSPQEKQKVWEQEQVTGCVSTYCTFIALLHSGWGHHRRSRLHSTKLLVMRCWYFNFTLGSAMSFITVWSSTKMSHPWAAQEMVWPMPSSIILVVR